MTTLPDPRLCLPACRTVGADSSALARKAPRFCLRRSGGRALHHPGPGGILSCASAVLHTERLRLPDFICSFDSQPTAEAFVERVLSPSGGVASGLQELSGLLFGLRRADGRQQLK
jgi:hypothetical protein